jgi:hypothetical protein
MRLPYMTVTQANSLSLQRVPGSIFAMDVLLDFLRLKFLIGGDVHGFLPVY